ncbi:MAG: PQQ-dependent sugar dehydrogenase [Candidatus Nitrosocaldus sp.]|nr:PQQ-dependent sugar dehydrogenase [Candidatus Nitrosocaldus sp.]
MLAGLTSAASAYTVDHEVVADRLSRLGHCGANFEFLPDGRIICGGLRDGKVYIITIKEGGFDYKEIGKVDIYLGEEGEHPLERGLVGLAIDPEFSNNRYIYLHWSIKGEDGKQYTRVARFMLDERTMLTDMKVLLEKPGNRVHIGGPLVFGKDNTMYITTGDAIGHTPGTTDIPFPEHTSQRMDSLAGKILRINRDGSIPDDNPFPNSTIYTLGHRNVFGIAVHPLTGILFVTENGPDTDDEVNILYPGRNYGWPLLLGYDQQYISKKSKPEVRDVNRQYTIANEDLDRFERPLLSSGHMAVAPTNMLFYTGDRYGEEFKYNLFFTTVNDSAIYRVILRPPDYTDVQDVIVYKGLTGALIDVEEYDGWIYIGSMGPSQIYRIVSFNPIHTAQRSSITLDVPQTVRKYDTLELTATVKDEQGRPITFGYVNFLINDNVIATVRTIAGIAKVSYTFVEEGEQRVSARFFLDGYEPSMDERIVRVEVARATTDLEEPAPEPEPVQDVEFRGPVYETLLDDVIARIRLSDNLDTSKPVVISVEFFDRRERQLDKDYKIIVMQGGKVIYEGGRMEQHVIRVEEEGSATIRLNLDGKSAEFNTVVVPEFPFHIIILALSFILLTITKNWGWIKH